MTTQTTTENELMRFSDSVRRFVRMLDLTNWDVMPKMYFEFTDMHKMRRCECLIMAAIQDRLKYTVDAPKRKVDADAVELTVAGVTFVLRCMSRLASMQGTDVGYTAVKFMERKL